MGYNKGFVFGKVYEVQNVVHPIFTDVMVVGHSMQSFDENKKDIRKEKRFFPARPFPQGLHIEEVETQIWLLH